MEEQQKIYDIGIIGCGVAGMSAAIQAGRFYKSVAIIDKDGFGGNIAKSSIVENIPGFTSISGINFATKIYEQMSTYSTISHILGKAIYLDYKHGLMLIHLEDRNVVCCQSVIIATGTQPKELKLNTKNIYYCLNADTLQFKNKNVFVVGSGNSGAAYALELATYCKNVYLCDITTKMLCEPATAKKIEENSKIHWLPNCTITNVKNDKDGNLASVQLSTYETIKVNAIFAAIGMEPKTDIFKQFVDIENGYIKSDESCLTNKVPGIFVAGDCRTKKVRQVTTAVSDGTTAAIEAIKFLNK